MLKKCVILYRMSDQMTNKINKQQMDPKPEVYCLPKMIKKKVISFMERVRYNLFDFNCYNR